MKLAIGVNDLSDETLQFAEQYGVTHLKVNAGDYMDERRRGPVQEDKLKAAIARAASRHLKIWVALLPQEVGSQHWNIRLGRPGREREVEDVCRSLEILGKAGIPVVEYVFNLSAVYGSQYLPTGRGGAVVRNFDYGVASKAPAQPEFAATVEEVWQRIEYFMKRVVPAAESAGVKLACHPDDPPVPRLKGENRVLGNIEGLERLLAIVPSPSNGLNFCQGTIAEMGVDVIETIHRFGSRNKIFHVHFRNIKRALPKFEESFIDDGDTDMWQALQAYKDVGYTGTLIPDHWPNTASGAPWTGQAYALGYMRAMMERLQVLEE